MRKLLALTIIMAMVIGCAGISFKPVPNDCINKADYPNSMILQKLDNPCAPHRFLVSAAKAGLAMDSITYEDLHNDIEGHINALGGLNSISARAVKDVILAEVMKANAIVGGAAFMLSDTFLLFSDEVLFGSDDIKVLILSLRDIDAQAKAMADLMR